MTLQDIRKRLNGVGESWGVEESSLSWNLYEMDKEGHDKKIIKAPKHSIQHAEYWPTDAESDFIEHAPEDIKELLEIIDEGREIVDALELHHDRKAWDDKFNKKLNEWLKKVSE